MITQDVDKATLIGLSMGGVIVLKFALLYPNQFETMVLLTVGVWKRGVDILTDWHCRSLGNCFPVPVERDLHSYLGSFFTIRK